MQTENQTDSTHSTGDGCNADKIQVAVPTQVMEDNVSQVETVSVENLGFTHHEFLL